MADFGGGASMATGLTGLTGWDQYASQSQLERSAATRSGHPDAATLTHLTQALYIPRHDTKTAHVPVTYISAQYAAATEQLPLGSSKYMVALGLMAKPSPDAPISHEVSFTGREEVVGSVRSSSETVELRIRPQEKETAAILTTGGNEIPLTVTYPIPASVTRDGTFLHPYFTFQLPHDSQRASTFTWEIHPSEQGRMRYTLVRRRALHQQQGMRIVEVGVEQDVQAVYYHVGYGASLSLPYSEGILLLPLGSSPARTSLVVASALGMLRRLRELQGVSEVGKESKKKLRLKPVKGLFKKGE